MTLGLARGRVPSGGPLGAFSPRHRLASVQGRIRVLKTRRNRRQGEPRGRGDAHCGGTGRAADLVPGSSPRSNAVYTVGTVDGPFPHRRPRTRHHSVCASPLKDDEFRIRLPFPHSLCKMHGSGACGAARGAARPFSSGKQPLFTSWLSTTTVSPRASPPTAPASTVSAPSVRCRRVPPRALALDGVADGSAVFGSPPPLLHPRGSLFLSRFLQAASRASSSAASRASSSAPSRASSAASRASSSAVRCAPFFRRPPRREI